MKPTLPMVLGVSIKYQELGNILPKKDFTPTFNEFIFKSKRLGSFFTSIPKWWWQPFFAITIILIVIITYFFRKVTCISLGTYDDCY